MAISGTLPGGIAPYRRPYFLGIVPEMATEE